MHLHLYVARTNAPFHELNHSKEFDTEPDCPRFGSIPPRSQPAANEPEQTANTDREPADQKENAQDEDESETDPGNTGGGWNTDGEDEVRR